MTEPRPTSPQRRLKSHLAVRPDSRLTYEADPDFLERVHREAYERPTLRWDA
jgi:hypothetical protein